MPVLWCRWTCGASQFDGHAAPIPRVGREVFRTHHPSRFVLLVLGFVLAIPILWTIGIILIVAGAVLTILGTTGRAIGGRKTWY